MASNPGPGTERGYPREIVVGDFDQKFICSDCRLILRDPVQSFCGHRFCRSCIDAVIRSGQTIRCAVCVSEGVEDDYSLLQPDQMFPDNAVKREMSKLKTKCVNPGCQWEGLFREYENSHIKNCQFRATQCPKCGEVIPLALVDQHEKQQCPHRISLCKHCKTEMSLRELEQEHFKVCKKHPVKCDLCGKKKIPQEKLQLHKETECPNAKVMCPVGCGELERSKMQEHLTENSSTHMTWIIQGLQSLDTQLREVTATSSDTSQVVGRIENLEQKIAEVEQQVRQGLSQGAARGQESGGDIPQLVERCQTLEGKIGTFEGIAAALHREIEKIITALERHDRQQEEGRENYETLSRKLLTVERTLALKDIALTEQDLRIQSLEFASYTGSLVWKIPNFSQKQQEASRGKSISIYSPAFYSSRLGYKMCARLYPNGDGMGKGSHVSLFFVVMRGHYDALLQWPFQQRVTFMLVNQQGADHVIDSFRPDPSSSSFKRPTSDMNIASGSPLFIRLAVVQDQSSGFLKDDSMFIKISVDTSNLVEPLLTDSDRIRVTTSAQ